MHLLLTPAFAMTPSTNLVRVCRDSGLSGSDIQGLVNALQSRGRSSARKPRGLVAERSAGLVTSAVAFARTLLSTLR
jgi:hypothetical protein